MKQIVCCPGTNEWPSPGTAPWFQTGSAFSDLLLTEGYTQALPDEIPAWSSELGGVKDLTSRAWEYGAAVTIPRVLALDEADRNIIGASHGGQVAARIASRVDCARLLTIGTPVRHEMAEIYATVTCPWLHVYSTGWENRWQYFGQLFDRHVGFSLQMPAPAQNIRLEGTGHVDLVREPARFDTIYQRVILPFLDIGVVVKLNA
jgi:hypothetical protein